MMAVRYAHAKQFKRINRELKFLHTRLGRLIRGIRGKTEGDEDLQTVFAVPLIKASQIRGQKQRQRGRKLYSWHAPETECIRKGKARAPYEFGVKVSLTTTNIRCKPFAAGMPLPVDGMVNSDRQRAQPPARYLDGRDQGESRGRV